MCQKNIILSIAFIVIYFTNLLNCYSQSIEQKHRIAFISDAHLQDIITYPKLIRTMDAQVQSTRLFNENYFALIAALNDVAKRGISLVVLPGDLTDDGQLVNQEAIKHILNDYTKRYNMSFFVTTGNHDPLRPSGTETIRNDYLAPSGGTLTISSKKDSININCRVEIDTTLRSVGYKEEMDCYANFGYFPQSEYIYWESPFSDYTYDTYNYQQAVDENKIEKRHYALCDSIIATDASYLVEPVKDLWLLAIDGGVYLPAGMKNGVQEYRGSEIGYNNIMKYKSFLLPWIRKIVFEANRRNKNLITFCHYPLVDCNSGASKLIANAWGKDKFDLLRIPEDSVAEIFSDIGLRLHVAGHMHLNNTGVAKGKHKKQLYNIQVPSIAAYIPAYKILTFENSKKVKIETVILDSVSDFNRLFNLYKNEYIYAKAIDKQPIWSIESLNTKDYIEFCDWQFKDLVRTRFIPKDLPKILRDSLITMTNKQLFLYVSHNKQILSIPDTLKWTGFDLILDLYRLRYAGELALVHIPRERLIEYLLIFNEVKQQSDSSEFIKRMRELADIFNSLLHSEPNVNFTIDLEKDIIKIDE